MSGPTIRHTRASEEPVFLRSVGGHPTLFPGGAGRVDLAVQSYFYDYDAHLPTECSVFARPHPPNDLTQMALDEGLGLGHCPQATINEPPDPLVIVGGMPIDAAFSLLNLGTASQSVQARLIMTAQNDPNPTAFTVVDTWAPTLNPNTPYQVERTFTVPTSLRMGVYYVILQLDHNEEILAEADRSNNQAFWNQQVAVVPPETCGCRVGPLSTGPASWGLVALMVLLRRRRHH